MSISNSFNGYVARATEVFNAFTVQVRAAFNNSEIVNRVSTFAKDLFANPKQAAGVAIAGVAVAGAYFLYTRKSDAPAAPAAPVVRPNLDQIQAEAQQKAVDAKREATIAAQNAGQVWNKVQQQLNQVRPVGAGVADAPELSSSELFKGAFGISTYIKKASDDAFDAIVRADLKDKHATRVTDAVSSARGVMATTEEATRLANLASNTFTGLNTTAEEANTEATKAKLTKLHALQMIEKSKKTAATAMNDCTLALNETIKTEQEVFDGLKDTIRTHFRTLSTKAETETQKVKATKDTIDLAGAQVNTAYEIVKVAVAVLSTKSRLEAAQEKILKATIILAKTNAPFEKEKIAIPPVVTNATTKARESIVALKEQNTNFHNAWNAIQNSSTIEAVHTQRDVVREALEEADANAANAERYAKIAERQAKLFIDNQKLAKLQTQLDEALRVLQADRVALQEEVSVPVTPTKKAASSSSSSSSSNNNNHNE